MNTRFKYHAFISFAFEDKESLAEPIAMALKAAGFNIWYSGTELKPGDTVERKILDVIPHCKYAVVILSRPYLNSKWMRTELNAFASLETTGRQIILPIWNGVSQEEVKEMLPFQVDRFAVQASQGIPMVLSKLIAVLKRRNRSKTSGEVVESRKERAPKTNGGIVIQATQVKVDAQNISGGDIKIHNNNKT